MLDRPFLKIILTIAIIINNPTPKAIPTVKIVGFITFATCPARTFKSGSAIVINKPSKKEIISNNPSLRFFARPDPTADPIGVIARSAPNVNNAIPIIKNIVDTKNITISEVPTLTNGVNAKTTTIATTGKTDIAASFNFSKLFAKETRF